jgi:hypothetical protein
MVPSILFLSEVIAVVAETGVLDAVEADLVADLLDDRWADAGSARLVFCASGTPRIPTRRPACTCGVSELTFRVL